VINNTTFQSIGIHIILINIILYIIYTRTARVLNLSLSIDDLIKIKISYFEVRSLLFKNQVSRDSIKLNVSTYEGNLCKFNTLNS